MELAGDVRDQRILDLACGEGFYTRRLKAAGAARVLGIDVSAEMIALWPKRRNVMTRWASNTCAPTWPISTVVNLDRSIRC